MEYVVLVEEMRNPHRIVTARPERNLGVDRRIILKCILKEQNYRVDWIHLTHDRLQWLALVNNPPAQ
jgi:hypothetical protein